ncbi:MAG TPA: InlB B-repeat-containing protein [Bacilli bacterium]|nr:InlB B-repeat-containing protein [Bacilli bacterium]
MFQKVLFAGRVLFIGILVFFLSACDAVNFSGAYITGIEIDPTSVDDQYAVGQFRLEDIRLLIKKSDNTQMSTPLGLQMIEEGDKTKLTQVGEHTINVTYFNKTTTFTIRLVEQSAMSYHITYDLNGGTLTSGSINQTIIYGGYATNPVCEKEGYVFKGWFYQNGDIFGDEFAVTNHASLKAKWNKLHKVTFVNDFYEVIEIQYVEDGTDATPPDASKLGYLLTWNVEYANVTYDILVVAIYTPQYMNVTYNYNTYTEQARYLLGTTVELPRQRVNEIEIISWSCFVGETEIGVYPLKTTKGLTVTVDNITCNATWGPVQYKLSYHEVYDLFNADNSLMQEEYVTELHHKAEGFALVLTNKGRVFAWGVKVFYSPLGTSPMEIPLVGKAEDEFVVKVASGSSFAYALTNKNQVYYYDHKDVTGYYKNKFYNETIQFYPINNNNDIILDMYIVDETVFFLTEQHRIYATGVNKYYTIFPDQNQSMRTSTIIDITERFGVLNNTEHFTKIVSSYGAFCGITNFHRVIYWNHIERTPIDITDDFALEPNELILDISDDYYVYTSDKRLIYFSKMEELFEVVDMEFMNEDEYIIAFSDNRILTNQMRLIDLKKQYYYAQTQITDLSFIESPETIVQLNSHSFLTNHGRIFTWGSGNGTYKGGYPYPVEMPSDDESLVDEYYIKTMEQVRLILDENETIIDSIINTMDYVVLTSNHRVITGGFNVLSNLSGRFGDGTFSSRLYALDITERFYLEDGEIIEGLFLEKTYSVGAYTSHSRIFTWGDNASGSGTLYAVGLVSSPIDITPNFNLQEEEVFISYDKRVITSLNRVFEVNGNFIINNIPYLNLPMDITSYIDLESEEVIIQTIENDIVITSLGNVYFFHNYNYEYNIVSKIATLEPGEIISQHVFEDDKVMLFLTTKGNIFRYIVNTGQWQLINGYFELQEDEYISSVVAWSETYFVLTSNNRMYSWGDGERGYIGNGRYDNQELSIEITNYFELIEDETIISVSVNKYTWVVYATTSEGRLFTWGYNSPFARLNNTPRPISYLESREVAMIELVAVEDIIHPEIQLDGRIVTGYYLDIERYQESRLMVMPSRDMIIYLKTTAILS